MSAIEHVEHVGMSPHRYKQNPMELAFAKAWRKQHEPPFSRGTLNYLLCPDNRGDAPLSQRDATVAATVIQWLGSPAGQDFLKSVLEVGK